MHLPFSFFAVILGGATCSNAANIDGAKMGDAKISGVGIGTAEMRAEKITASKNGTSHSRIISLMTRDSDVMNASTGINFTSTSRVKTSLDFSTPNTEDSTPAIDPSTAATTPAATNGTHPKKCDPVKTCPLVTLVCAFLGPIAIPLVLLCLGLTCCGPIAGGCFAGYQAIGGGCLSALQSFSMGGHPLCFMICGFILEGLCACAACYCCLLYCDQPST